MGNEVPVGGRVINVTGGQRLLCYESVTSTMDAARALAKAGEPVVGVIARFQSSGRGRAGRHWDAPSSSCLLATYLVDYGGDHTGIGRLALAAGLAVAESIDHVSGLSTRLKWPNDVIICERKIAGILVETAVMADQRVIALVGVGVNVNVEAFDSPLDGSATSVRIESGSEWSVDLFESAIRERLFAEAESIRRNELASIIERWRARDASTGRRYRAIINGREIVGVATGIAEDAGLIIRPQTGERFVLYSATSVIGEMPKPVESGPS